MQSQDAQISEFRGPQRRWNVAMIDYIYSYAQSKAEGSSTDVCV